MYSRYRTRGGLTPIPTYTIDDRWTACDPTWVPRSPASNPLLKVGLLQTMSDNVIPGFYKRQRRGEIFFNDMSQASVECTNPVAGIGPQVLSIASHDCSGTPRFSEYRIGVGWAQHIVMLQEGSPASGVPPVVRLLSDSEVNAVTGEASTKSLAGRGTAGSNLFESLAEIRQTTKLLRRPFSSANRLLQRGETLRSKGKSAAECWLQYRYGWLPLVRDIGTVMDGLKKRVGNKRMTSRGTANFGRTSVTSHVRGTSGSGDYIVYYQKQTSDFVDSRAMSLDEYYVTVLDNVGLSTKNLVSLPWELIPYSFVADWFLNLGDVLKALIPLPGVKPLGSCVTTTRVTQTNWNILNASANAGKTIVRQPSGQVTVKATTKTRTPAIQPSLLIRNDFRLSEAERLADAVSLLVQRADRVFK